MANLIKPESLATILATTFADYRHSMFKLKPNQGIYMRFELDMENYKNDKRSIKVVHIVITSRHNVFMYVESITNGFKQFSELALDKFKNVSNHDTCWREELSLHSVVMDMYEECYKDTDKEKRPIPAYTFTDVYTKLGTSFLGNRIIEFVEIELENLNSNDSYRKKIVAMRRLKATLILE